MFQLTQYASSKEPKVQKQITLGEVLAIIKNGDKKLPLVQYARTLEKGTVEYDDFRRRNFPTFRFNFLFKHSASNRNITTPTGLIYIDSDKVDTIPESPYILASWKSLSNKGFGILVKVDNLTLSNYADTYNQLSELIGVTSDTGARKATQQTIQSYDPDLYHNPDSLVFRFTESEKVSHAPILEKREKCIGTGDTLKDWNEDSIRFNNISDYFTDDTPYLVFKEKIRICNPFIPMRIEQGKRNSTLFFLLSQYALLNPNAGKPFLNSIAESINKHIFPRLSLKEIKSVCESVLKKRDEGSLTMYYNEERRILFNPKSLITNKQKSIIVNQELGKLKSDATREQIHYILEDWDFEANGAITQKKVSAQTSRGIATVKRYWSEFKDYAKTLSDDFERKQEQSAEQSLRGISIEKYLYNMRCKFVSMEVSDEKFLLKAFKQRDIRYVTDKGFDEVHRFMWEILKSRQALLRAA